MKFRLIALDVDGTLLNDHYEITPETADAVRRAHETGARIVLCTGRAPDSAYPILEELGLKGALITHNGGATVMMPDRELLHSYSFDSEAMRPCVEFARDRGLHFDVCTSFSMYAEKLGEVEKAMYKKYLLTPTMVNDALTVDEPIVKFTVFSDKAVLDEVEEEFMGLFRHTAASGLHTIRSGDCFIDVMRAEATKGNALRNLADRWGIGREEIMAIGNYFNDLAMLEYAGLGIAMGNSPEGVKLRADAITASNNEDGVAKAILHYMHG